MATNTTGWRCTVCGFIAHGAEPPECCPVCGAGRTDFEPAPAPAAAADPVTERWRCLNCTYIHTGDAPPEACPLCGATADRFEPLPPAETSGAAAEFDGHLVVIGAGIAGVSAIESLRELTSKGTITLLAREADLPYYRLNLTRFLAGELTHEAMPIHDAAWYHERNIDLRTAADVSHLDLNAGAVFLHGGEKLLCDRILMTVGAHPFVPPLEGTAREGVKTLRTLRDAEQILEHLAPGMEAVCVGGGLLGLEAAGALANRGADITLLESHEWLMPRQLNERAGDILQRHCESIGITVLRNARTAKLVGDERVAGVQLDDGRSAKADMVILATGVRPNSHLGRRIGIDVNNGVVVDNHLRTSHPTLYAAGDVAEHHGVLYGSWAASQFQGSIAGRNVAGLSDEFGGLPRTNTLKVLGLDLVSIGTFQAEDGSFTVVETQSDSPYARFVFRDTHLVGAVLIGDATLSGPVKQAIENRLDFSDALAGHAEAGAIVECLGTF